MRDEYEKKLRKAEGQLELTKVSLQQAVREKSEISKEKESTSRQLAEVIKELRESLEKSKKTKETH